MNAWINFLKPPGMTSSDAVVLARRLLGIKRIGHGGTLDPAAAGVLPIGVGKAARLFDYLHDTDKVYIFEMTLGIATDTCDAQGVVLRQVPARVSAAQINAVLPAFAGLQSQVPPVYAAIKVGGQKLYKLARAGAAQDIQVPAREVTISALELLEQTGEQRFLLRVQSSRGMYVRALCRDIAAALGTEAYLSLLLRTQASVFTLGDACTVEQLTQAAEQGDIDRYLLPAQTPVMHYPAVTVPGAGERPIRNGLPIAMPGLREGALYRVYLQDALMGMGIAFPHEGCTHLRIRTWLLENQTQS